MVSNTGIMLANGYQPFHHRNTMHHRGSGIVRSAVAGLAGVAGRALLNKLVSAISGSGRKRKTYKKRATHTVRGSSWKVVGTGKKRTYRRKTIGTVRKHRIGSGYRRTRRHVGRPRTRKIGTIRRRRILII